MNTLIEIIFACLAIGIIVLFLPEIIGLGVILGAMFYLVCFVTGFTHGKG